MELLSLENIDISFNKVLKIKGENILINSGDVVLLTGPNGCGKSSIIKLIMSDMFEYTTYAVNSTNIKFKEKYNILHSEKDSEFFRKQVCYISQEDSFESVRLYDCMLMSINYNIISNQAQYIYEYIERFNIQDSFNIDGYPIDSYGKKIINELGLNINNLNEKQLKIIKLLSLNTNKMSGGQKKLANIIANLVRYDFCSLIIIDEPINNLDYNSVRFFNNLLAHIYYSKPELGIIIVTHCRSITIINKILEINPKTELIEEKFEYKCNSCFGDVDDKGYYI